MKKMIAWLLLLLFLASMAGCDRSVAPDTLPLDPAVPEAPVPELPDPPMPSVQENETPPAPEEPAPLPSILDGRIPQDETGILWQIPCPVVEEAEYQNLCLFGDDLLLSRADYGGNPYADNPTVTLHLALLSLESGEVLHEASIVGTPVPEVQVCGDHVAVSDWGTSTVTILDSSLTQVRSFQSNIPWTSAYVSTDASSVYCLTTGDGILVTDLATGETTTLLEQGRDIWASHRQGSTVTLSYVDLSTQFSTYAALDLSTGALTRFPFDGAFSSVACNGTQWLSSVLGTQDIYLTGSEDQPQYLQLAKEHGYLTLLDGPGHLMSSFFTDSGSELFFLYSTDGSFLSSFGRKDAWNEYASTPVWCERFGGYFFTLTDFSGATRLMFWDLTADSAGAPLEAIPLSDTQPEAGSAVAQELYDRAADLSARYGVTIRIADQCDTEYYTYSTEQVTDYWLISEGLDALEQALAQYPEGFMQQLCYGYYRTLEINLTGRLTPTSMPEDGNGFSTFIAFVENHDAKTVMVLDLSEGSAISQHFHHELSHVIDGKLTFDATYRADALFSEDTWASYNPQDFSYEQSYYYLSEGIYSDGYDSYFIDIYSRTFPTEDRARILEYAMTDNEWAFSGNIPLQEKLAYYAACIRDSFDTTGWPEVTVWELPLP